MLMNPTDSMLRGFWSNWLFSITKKRTDEISDLTVIGLT